MKIKRLRGFLRDKSDTVTTLEKRKLQLDTAMKERRHEIGIHMDMITAQVVFAGGRGMSPFWIWAITSHNHIDVSHYSIVQRRRSEVRLTRNCRSG